MKRQTFRKPAQKRRGQGLVEYIIIVASVALISLVALSMFGHKVADQYAVGAGMLPGAHAEDNNPISTGFFAEVGDANGNVVGTGGVSWADITGTDPTTGELVNNVTRANGDNSAGVFVGEDGDGA